MKIVTAPHDALRQEAAPVLEVDQKVKTFIEALSQTLKGNLRRGVGLAAPQVDTQLRLFVTHLAPDGSRDDRQRELSVYINPRIAKASRQVELGGTKKSTPLEGCLSIPSLFGPVPRHPWVEVEYQVVVGNSLESRRQRFEGFPARLAQHEIDHLDGILFTDYSLEFDLPLYLENEDGELVDFKNRDIIETF